jgi:hypothetical protein
MANTLLGSTVWRPDQTVLILVLQVAVGVVCNLHAPAQTLGQNGETPDVVVLAGMCRDAEEERSDQVDGTHCYCDGGARSDVLCGNDVTGFESLQQGESG